MKYSLNYSNKTQLWGTIFLWTKDLVTCNFWNAYQLKKIHLPLEKNICYLSPGKFICNCQMNVFNCILHTHKHTHTQMHTHTHTLSTLLNEIHLYLHCVCYDEIIWVAVGWSLQHKWYCNRLQCSELENFMQWE